MKNKLYYIFGLFMCFVFTSGVYAEGIVITVESTNNTNVIKESVYVAMGYIRTNNFILDIDNKVFLENDFHIHFESGAVFKEGPSAGVALITSLISLIKKKPIDSSISMTGEITLRGKILPVGGIKEKILVAINNNVKTIYVPIDNKADVKELPKDIIKGIKIKYINNYLELYNDLF